MMPIQGKNNCVRTHVSGSLVPGDLGCTVSPIDLCSFKKESPRNKKYNSYRSIALSTFKVVKISLLIEENGSRAVDVKRDVRARCAHVYRFLQQMQHQWPSEHCVPMSIV